MIMEDTTNAMEIAWDKEKGEKAGIISAGSW
jgi:hypothetical protein